MKMLSVSLKGVSKLLSSRNKTKTSAVAFILLLASSAVLAILPAFAQKTYTAVPDRETATVVGASPKLVGLGQKVLINIMTYPAPSGPNLYAQDLVGRTEAKGGFNGTSITITKPDGTKDTFMPIDETLEHAGLAVPGLQQIVGSLQFQYEPDQVGTYSLTASFAGEIFTTDASYASLNLSVYYKPSSTRQAATFAVQDEIVLSGVLNGYPWSPLPTAYWTETVSTDIREWAAISGDWIMGGYDPWGTKYNPYSTAPSSPHIMWKNRVQVGGIVGGVWGSLSYGGVGGGGGTAFGGGNIIVDGKIYQNDIFGGTYSCIDLITGQKLWNSTGAITQAQHLQPLYQTFTQGNEGGIVAYLWDFGVTGQWRLWDPFTGTLRQVITGAPTDSTARSLAEGSTVVYLVQYGGWNTTLPLKYRFENLIRWDLAKVATNNDWKTGIVWNVSIRQPDGVGIGDGRTNMNCLRYDEANVVIVKAGNDEDIVMGFDMDTGAYLYRATTPIVLFSTSAGPNGPYLIATGMASWYAMNVKTGSKMWETQVGDLPWAEIPVNTNVAHDGKFYVGCFDGHVYALDLDDGHIVWKSDYVGDDGETIYGNQPFNGAAAGADGKLYFSTDTVYGLQPRTRFHELVCIDEATGKFLWKLPIGIRPNGIANGYLVGADGENGLQYCIGKGKTAITITAPMTTISVGTGALIQGQVMDMSPAQANTPAVSEGDMSEWMDYLHGQNATMINSPPTPDGVPVQLTAVSSSGSVTDLGTVTSDSSGTFGTMWAPSAAGMYTVYATFAGSNSYWSSNAETLLGVQAAAEPSTTPGSTANNSEVINYVIAAAVAIIIAIAIVGVLMLKKGKQ